MFAIKRTFLLKPISCLFVITLLFSSCAKEDEIAPVDPSADPESFFLGTWYVSEKSTLYGNASYNISIADSTDSHVLIKRLYGFQSKIVASVSGSSISITSQIVEGSGISGYGTLVTNKRINLKYYVNDGINKDTVTASLWQ